MERTVERRSEVREREEIVELPESRRRTHGDRRIAAFLSGVVVLSPIRTPLASHNGGPGLLLACSFGLLHMELVGVWRSTPGFV